MSYEKKKQFLVNFLFYALLAAIFIFTIKYALKWILPFVIAFAVSAFITPMANKLSKYFKIKKKFAAFFCTFLFYSIAIGLIALIGFGLYGVLKNFFSHLPYIYENSIAPTISSVSVWIEEFLSKIDPMLSKTIIDATSGFSKNFGSLISAISVGAASWLSAYIKGIPFFFAEMFIAVIATFFISSDYTNIRAFIIRQIPEKWHLFLKDVREHSLRTILKYFKSYFLIMTITFCELCLALWLLKVKNFAVIALVIAVFDIIPVCGSGGVLIPWAVFSIIQGNYPFGIALLIAYGIIAVIRQIIEPKIIGDQVGLPAIVTLMAMFLGVRFMGVLGLFVFPITLVILKNLNDSGRIKLFK